MKQIITLLATLSLATAAWAQGATTPGEVTKIDKAAGRVTLKHAGIQSLDMPPMTLSFHVSSQRMLDNIVVGDRVRFTAERIGGQYTITSVSKAP